MTFLSVLVTIIGTIGVFAILPQVIKIFRRKSAKDISILAYALFIIVNFVWFLYSIEIKSFPLGFTSIIAIIFQIVIVIGWLKYGREDKKKRKN